LRALELDRREAVDGAVAAIAVETLSGRADTSFCARSTTQITGAMRAPASIASELICLVRVGLHWPTHVLTFLAEETKLNDHSMFCF